MKELYLALIALLRVTYTAEQLHVDIWNDQLASMEGQEIYSFRMPAVFFEFQNTSDVQTLGKGLQIYNDLIVRAHVVHQELDAADGTVDRNVAALVFKQDIFALLDVAEPTGAAMFARNGEEEDKSHTNIYHFIQDYKTNYVDKSRERPIGAVLTTPPTTLELDVEIVDEIDE